MDPKYRIYAARKDKCEAGPGSVEPAEVEAIGVVEEFRPGLTMHRQTGEQTVDPAAKDRRLPLVDHAQRPTGGRQQLLVMMTRARKPGENILGGVSTRRLISFPVNLST